MRITFFLLTQTSCLAALLQQPTPAIKLRATVQDVVPLVSFSGPATSVDLDPKYALTLHIETATGGDTNFVVGTIVTIGIHSPSKVFAGDPVKGEAYDLELDRKIERGNVTLSGLRLQKSAVLAKQVLLHESGRDRHWVMKAGDLIKEEHYLTAHGDLHIAVEYPTGVHNPQVESKGERENAEAVTRAYWRNGGPMSVTPQVGGQANGRDLVWWPNKNIAREALFTTGVPAGTWKFYDQAGKFVGEGTYQNGKRWSGVFAGSERPGADFFFTEFPMKKQTYRDGNLVGEEEFLKELREE